MSYFVYQLHFSAICVLNTTWFGQDFTHVLCSVSESQCTFCAKVKQSVHSQSVLHGPWTFYRHALLACSSIIFAR